KPRREQGQIGERTGWPARAPGSVAWRWGPSARKRRDGRAAARAGNHAGRGMTIGRRRRRQQDSAYGSLRPDLLERRSAVRARLAEARSRGGAALGAALRAARAVGAGARLERAAARLS